VLEDGGNNGHLSSGYGVWLSLTTDAMDWEVEFNGHTLQYRHRLRRVVPTADPSILIVRYCLDAGEWRRGLPPPYQIWRASSKEN
jgi:hypothetical protein